jgi:uncharacterized membrane protein YphA (DoxX/SURF4 family)
MTQGDVAVRIDPAPAEPSPRQWGARAAHWAEQVIPRVVGAIFLWAGATKAWDASKIHRVFAFDGVPQSLIVSLTHVVWVSEIILGIVLLVGIARRPAVVAAIFVLFVYSVQLAYLIAADNPPKDCGCINIMAKYASAKQAMTFGLLRNALMAACLEWVRLRIVGRALAAAAGSKQEDG